MMGAILMGVVVVITAALLTWLLVSLALTIAKAARCRKSRYFSIQYRYKYGTEFCRAHLVGKAGKLNHKVLYVVEIHPKDAAKAHAWIVPEAKLCGRHLLVGGRFYRYAFKEELYG